MKKKFLFAAMTAAAMFASCEKPVENEDQNGNQTEEPVLVESVELDASVAEGYSLLVGATLDLSGLVTVLPENADDKTVTYSSSDEAKATVSDAGIVTAVAAGTSEITAKAGEKTATFTLTVTEPAPEEIAITSLVFDGTEKDYELATLAGAVDLKAILTVEPANHTEAIVYESSDPEAVSVTASGEMTVHKLTEGVTITAKAANNADVAATLTVKAYKLVEGSIDYDRSAWTMTCSQDPLPTTPKKNSLTAMFDNDMVDGVAVETNFGVTRPGKKSGGVDLSKADVENYEISFTIDMQVAQKVEYFNIRHISTSGPDFGTRFAKFSQILGSSDGSSFTEISGLLDFSDKAGVTTEQMTGNISIPASECRYLKFVMKGIECYDPSGKNNGNTAQIKELYLGYNGQKKVYSE